MPPMNAEQLAILRDIARRNPRYAVYLPATPAAKRLPLYPCIHRGGRTGEGRECQEGCGKGKMIPLQQCSEFGMCSVAVSVGPGVPVCKTCSRREPSGKSR